jgi:hypothetical protein
MNDDTHQAVKETCAAIFYAMLSLYDDAAERESIQLLRDLVASGGIRHPSAREILTSIVRNSKALQTA